MTKAKTSTRCPSSSGETRCSRCQERIAELEAENARLRAELTRAAEDIQFCQDEIRRAYCPEDQPEGVAA